MPTTQAKPATRVALGGSIKFKVAKNTSIWVARGPVTLKKTDFLNLYREDPIAHLGIVKQGVAPTVIDGLAGGMNVTRDKLLATLGLKRETMRRRAKANQALTIDESSRVLGMSRLIGQVQAMLEASGTADGFDAAAWVGAWLDRPLPALGGKRPAELMDSAEGQAIVANMLARSQSGVYA